MHTALYNTYSNLVNFKGARAQKIGLKVLILKYDLGKSLPKEMWCEMADTKNVTTYFKSKKVHVI